MKPLFTLFWQLCVFRRGPQDVPYSPVLLAVLVLAELLLGAAIVGRLETAYMGHQMMGMVVALSAWLAMVWGLLRFKGLEARYVQAMTACLGTDLLLSAVTVPLQLYILSLPLDAGVGTWARVALLLTLIWDILVKGRIYGAALGLGRLQANLLSITIWVIVLLLSDVFMPAEALEAMQPTQSSPSVEQSISE
ncbi:MAG: hypothetical protein VYA55_02125 [Pseudomonadota bacterium]|nr:hypothetical protein [Pseudomonadota bacterium]